MMIEMNAVNITALEATLILIGVSDTEAVRKIYLAINALIETAHMQGYEEGYKDAEFEGLNDEAEGHAYEDGFNDGLAASDEEEAYDSGYLDGVREQIEGTAAPLVESIMADRAAEAAELAYEDAFQEAPRVHANVEGAIITIARGEVFNELVLKHAISNGDETN
jgi:hypothetical protein